MVVMAVLTAITLPALTRWRSDQRVKTSVRVLAAALGEARREALRTGNHQMAFFETDTLGAPLQDTGGNPVPVLVLDDGRPGDPGQNCLIDLGEPIRVYGLEEGITFGTSFATTAPPTDSGGGPFAGGSSFTDPGGNPARWVLFRPEGTPVAVSSACVPGAVGSGGGGVFVTNGHRDAGVVLTPLGVPHVHTWNAGTGQWTD